MENIKVKLQQWSLLYREYIVGFIVGLIVGAIIF
jgi:Mg/Co/Ni transporter MgtE